MVHGSGDRFDISVFTYSDIHGHLSIDLTSLRKVMALLVCILLLIFYRSYQYQLLTVQRETIVSREKAHHHQKTSLMSLNRC